MTSRFAILAGSVDGTATVPVGAIASKLRAHSTAGGTVAITTADGTTLPTITVPAAADELELEWDPSLAELAAGSSFAFTGTDGYAVTLAKVGASS